MPWQAFCVTIIVFSLQSSESLRWPAGTYGIPKPVSGCPRADGFRWQTGWRLQDTNYYSHHNRSNNSRSPEFHIDGKVTKIIVNRSFCMKLDTTDDRERPTWPQGNYCIYRKDNHCPKGLKPGWVFWHDDEEWAWSGNNKDGTLPDGIYIHNTEIKFCCKTDGDKADPILLPAKSSFYLLAYKSAKCQMVKWAVATVEWIYYDTENVSNTDGDQRGGSYPYNSGKKHPTIYYCYYKRCNKTLTTVRGTLQSPNYPEKYPDGQYCSWRIKVNTTQQIHLVFSSFSLQNEKDTDELYVYDGEDATGKVLGVFYGGHPPPKDGIYSSSNRMFLIFKSDKTDSYTGFSASYKLAPGITPTNGHIHTVMSSPAVAVGTTQPPDTTSSPTVTCSKTPEVTSSSTTTQSLEVTSLSTVSDTNPRSPELTHAPPITSRTLHTLKRGLLSPTTGEPSTTEPCTITITPPKEGGKKDESKQPQKKGFNVVPVVVSVVSAALIATIVGTGIWYCKRKKCKRLPGLDDAMYLRLNGESTASEENMEL